MFWFCFCSLVVWIWEISQCLEDDRKKMEADNRERKRKRRRRRKSEKFKEINYISSRVNGQFHVPKPLCSKKVYPTLRFIKSLPKLVSFESCVFFRLRPCIYIARFHLRVNILVEHILVFSYIIWPLQLLVVEYPFVCLTSILSYNHT